MFQRACPEIHESLYGLLTSSRTGTQIEASTGTGFMVSPEYIITVAHLIHISNDISQPRRQFFEAIRAPDVGGAMSQMDFITEDVKRDLALFKIINPTSSSSVHFELSLIQKGTPVGSLGYPLSKIEFNSDGTRRLYLVERFQSGYISSYENISISGDFLQFYGVNQLMYEGSSGCPGFLQNSRVIGMQARVLTNPKQQEQPDQSERVAISLWIPVSDILNFIRQQGIPIRVP